ncbi:MAG: serine/threonine protein phosphatase [Deltaproteobacteria bacterium]|nr:serine/threonine protein phosphatase [Deltaproteobacteria bacterium]
MKVVPGNAQHIGSRQEQQDDFGFSNLGNVSFVSHGGVLAILTDGMGGLAQGREASRIAKMIMLQQYEAKSEEESVPEALLRALLSANDGVVEIGRETGQEDEIGTTLAAAVVKDKELYWISVGDSRIYLWRQGELTQLTTDHDYARELEFEVAAGNLSQEEADAHPDRRALTSYLGLTELPEIDRNVLPIPVEPGDRILLCSDGLYNILGENEIAAWLEGDPQEAAEALVDEVVARNQRHQDNITVAILGCEPEWFTWQWLGRQNFGRWLALGVLIGLLGLGGGWYLAHRYFGLPEKSLAPSAKPPAEVQPAAPTTESPAIPAPTSVPALPADPGAAPALTAKPITSPPIQPPAPPVQTPKGESKTILPLDVGGPPMVGGQTPATGAAMPNSSQNKEGKEKKKGKAGAKPKISPERKIQ